MDEPDYVASTRAGYDATAGFYAEVIGTEITADIEAPLDRSLLATFVELVGITPGHVVDAGCGTGRVAALLASNGLDVSGCDLSPAMIDVARAAHPTVPFSVAPLTAMPYDVCSVAGVACWYSIIHTPPGDLGPIFDEVARITAPGGQVLVAFQAGDGQAVVRADVGGSGVELTNYRHDPVVVAAALSASGLRVHTRATREATKDHEKTEQAFLFATA